MIYKPLTEDETALLSKYRKMSINPVFISRAQLMLKAAFIWSATDRDFWVEVDQRLSELISYSEDLDLLEERLTIQEQQEKQ